MTVARPPPQVDCSKCGAGVVAPKEKGAEQTAEVAEQTALRMISAVRRPLGVDVRKVIITPPCIFDIGNC
jgi:hypothetical protein